MINFLDQVFSSLLILIKYNPTQDKTNVFEPNININGIKLFFEDVKVPKSNLLGEEGMGFKYMMTEVARERVSMAVESIGTVEGVLEKTIQYVQEVVLVYPLHRQLITLLYFGQLPALAHSLMILYFLRLIPQA